MDLTNENLKVMAARCVVALKDGSASLSTSIADIAVEYSLTKDQICRLIEASNQLAYLSELEGNDDRTFEFDVATYEDVLAKLMPDSSMDKVASVALKNPMDLISGSFSSIEKTASAELDQLQSMSRDEKIQALKKMASHEKNRLDELKSTEYDSLVKIAQYKESILRDPEALLKMAQFDNNLDMTKIVFGHTKVAQDVHRLWHDDEMKAFKGLSETITMCKQASEERSKLEPKVREAEEFIKQAYLAAVINAARTMGPKAVNSVKASKSPIMNKAKSAYKTFDAVDTSNEIRKKTTNKNQVWSGLRG